MVQLRHRMRLEEAHDFLAPIERIRALAAIRVLRGIDCCATRYAMTAAARHFLTVFEKFEKPAIASGPSIVSVVGIAGNLLRTGQSPA